MGCLADLISSGKKPLWIEATAYAERLMAGGAVPWGNVAEVVAWHRKSQSLLRSDVVSLPVAQCAEAWRQANGDLAAEMCAKKRTVAPLKTLLANEPLRAHLVEILKGLRASYPNQPLALTVPSPHCWLLDSYRAAFDILPEHGDDEIDSAAMYLADFLRTFGESGIDLLLLEETSATEPASDAALALYQSVFNVARHFRWGVGLHLPQGGPLGLTCADLDFVITPTATTAANIGLALSDEFWSGAAAPALPPNGFRYANVPTDATPEQVLTRLAVLRQ